MEKISVIIPVKHGRIARALDALKVVDYPIMDFEVIIAAGRHPSRQRNGAADIAQGDMLYFLDDDSIVASDALQRGKRHFSDPRVAAVGGPSLTPAGDSPLQKSFGLALSSALGGGSVRNRYRKTDDIRETDDRELILCNMLFRREVFLNQGGLDERLYPNEENELLARLSKDGWRLLHDPDLAVFRSQRPTFAAFARQIFGYGQGRAEQTLIAGFAGIANFMPSAFFLYLCLLPILRHPVYFLPLACYFAAVASFAALESFRSDVGRAFPLLFAIFPLLHLAYGAGMLRGFFAPRFRKERPQHSEEVELTVIKPFGAEWPTTDHLRGDSGPEHSGAHLQRGREHSPSR
ncbi:MAG: glycosyltransferase [Geobacteraceae bacterium]